MQYQWKLKSLPIILICKQTRDTSNLLKSVNIIDSSIQTRKQSEYKEEKKKTTWKAMTSEK